MNSLRVCPKCDSVITCTTRTCPTCGAATNRGRWSDQNEQLDPAPQSVFPLMLDALHPRPGRRRSETTDLREIVSDI